MGECDENLVHDVGVSKVHRNFRSSIKIDVLLNCDLPRFALATPRVQFPARLFDNECNSESDEGHERCDEHGIHKLGSD